MLDVKMHGSLTCGLRSGDSERWSPRAGLSQQLGSPCLSPCRGQGHHPWARSAAPWEPLHAMHPVLPVTRRQELVLSLKRREQVLPPPIFFLQDMAKDRSSQDMNTSSTMSHLSVNDHAPLHLSHKCTWPFQPKLLYWTWRSCSLCQIYSSWGDAAILKRNNLQLEPSFKSGSCRSCQTSQERWAGEHLVFWSDVGIKFLSGHVKRKYLQKY